ncbi:MAG: GNAT family N-acetyltransferase [Acidobacteriota bacterium]|nr:GNAT family N-acetyltransferase [Acidobacteriota bacterium]
MQIRRLTEIYEFEQVVELQRSIWQMSDLEIQPVDTFAVAEKTGGETLGAFEDGRMVGFCLGLPAIKENGTAYLHSHMLGVLPQCTNQGIGRALKLQQRQHAVTRGFQLIEWTFDPLQAKNAFFNIERLGAVVRRCYRNLYGQTSNALDAGLPTDRCVAEWWLESPRVKSVVDHNRHSDRCVVDRIEIPLDTQLLRTTDLPAARKVQEKIMSKLSESFANGLALIGVETTPHSAHYLIGKSGLE